MLLCCGMYHVHTLFDAPERKQIIMASMALLRRLSGSTARLPVNLLSSNFRNSSVAGSRLGICIRGLSTAPPDPYKTLDLPRDASEEDIKQAFRKKALATHPDRSPELPRERAEEAFAAVSNAYEVLKDPQKRQHYDTYGSIRDNAGGPTQAQQAEHARMVHEWLRAMHQRAAQQQQPSPKLFPAVDLEVWVRADVAIIHRASRACNISTEYDELRAKHAGNLGVIAKVDPQDKTCKVRLMVSPGSAIELWFGMGALWDPRDAREGLEVHVCPDIEATHRASRAAGIDSENDSRRARCAGKVGTVIKVDLSDQTAKVRVMVTASRADELWFAIGSIEPRAA